MARATTNASEAGGAWSPFRHTAFAMLWSATVLSNTGTWMNDVGAGWLMTTLAPTPLMIALVQAATTLPVFLFALPAGALAGLMDHRKLLIFLNVVLGLVAAAFALLVIARHITITLLLLFTFQVSGDRSFEDASKDSLS